MPATPSAPLLTTTNTTNGSPFVVPERFSTTPVKQLYVNPGAQVDYHNDLLSTFDPSVATVAWWQDDPNGFDTITMSNPDIRLFFSGKVRVSVRREIKIDKPRRQGVDGYQIISKGFDNARVRVHFTMYTPDQWKCYQTIAKYMKFTNLPTGAPVQNANTWFIIHPFLQTNGIDQVYFTSITSPEQQDIDKYTFELEGLEWKPTSNTNRTNAVSSTRSSTAPGTVVPTPQSRTAAPSQQAQASANSRLVLSLF